MLFVICQLLFSVVVLPSNKNRGPITPFLLLFFGLLFYFHCLRLSVSALFSRDDVVVAPPPYLAAYLFLSSLFPFLYLCYNFVWPFIALHL